MNLTKWLFRVSFSKKLTIGVVSMKQLRSEPSHASNWLASSSARDINQACPIFLIETLSRDAEQGAARL
jgi:hypothetical protein